MKLYIRASENNDNENVVVIDSETTWNDFQDQMFNTRGSGRRTIQIDDPQGLVNLCLQSELYRSELMRILKYFVTASSRKECMKILQENVKPYAYSIHRDKQDLYESTMSRLCNVLTSLGIGRFVFNIGRDALIIHYRFGVYSKKYESNLEELKKFLEGMPAVYDVTCETFQTSKYSKIKVIWDTTSTDLNSSYSPEFIK